VEESPVLRGETIMSAAVPVQIHERSTRERVEPMNTTAERLIGGGSNHGLLNPRALRITMLGGMAVLYALALVSPSLRQFLGRIAELLPN
jgi:hypothetical protein